MFESPTWLPPSYRLERNEDVLALRRSDGSLAGAFSARGATNEAVLRAAEDDRQGYPLYSGPEKHAESVRRMVRVRMRCSWERFAQTERRVLEARRNRQLAKALVRALPGESQEELDRMSSEDRHRAEEGLVELRSEEGDISYKHIDELVWQDRADRIRAELARLEWLLERQGRRNIIFRSLRATPRRAQGAPGGRTRKSLVSAIAGR